MFIMDSRFHGNDTNVIVVIPTQVGIHPMQESFPHKIPKNQKFNIEDPYYMTIKEAEKKTDLPGKNLPNAKKSPHIWRARLPVNMEKGKHLIHIHTTDMFGHEYKGYRIITIL